MQAQAPWFFRKRFTVYGLVYGWSFFFGFLLAGYMRVPMAPAFAASGHPWLVGSVAVACALGGYALRVWASSYLSSSVVWHDDVQTGTLTVSGPYRFTRNPLYLGNLLQAIGIGLVCPWPVLVLIAVAMTGFSLMLVGVEERSIAPEQGIAYDRYRAAVPRFVPLPWRIGPDAGQPASFADGVRSEKMTAAFAAAVIMVVLITWPR